MDRAMIGKCGLYCEECDFREQSGCPGCGVAGGDMFWGKCAIAKCCDSKYLEHCGRCGNFPCRQLENFAYDPEHGDNGVRLVHLCEWNDHGIDAWILNRSEEC